MSVRTAIVYDECGYERSIECAPNTTVEQLKEQHPEVQFRYWQEYSDRELAEWRLSMIDEYDQDLY